MKKRWEIYPVLAGAWILICIGLPVYAVDAYTVLAWNDGSGEPALVIHDADTGVVTLAKGLHTSDPEFKYVPVRRHGFFDGALIRAADLDGDGREDLILPAYSANRVLILWGAELDEPDIAVDELVTGPGPAAAAPALLGSSVSHDLLVANTARTRVEVRGWDVVGKKPVTDSAHYPAGFAQEGLFGFETAARLRGAADPVLGILRRDAGGGVNPVFEIFAKDPSPEYGPANAARSWESISAHKRLFSGFPDGEENPGWFLAYAPGSGVLEMFPSGPGEREWADLGEPVASAGFVPDVTDEVLVGFQNGDLAIYDFTPGTGFVLQQPFQAPPGMNFAAGAAGKDGTIAAVLTDGSGQLAQYRVFEKGAEDYELVNQGN